MINEGSLWDMAGRAAVVTLIGAGGKTTTLKGMAGEVKKSGLPVTMTTTTKVYPMEDCRPWRHPGEPPPPGELPVFWYRDFESSSGKWLGVAKTVLDEAIERESELRRRVWIIEGDGAKGQRLKLWAPHEPQIPQKSDCVVLILDGRLFGQVLRESDIHRADLGPELVGQVLDGKLLGGYLARSPLMAKEYQHMFQVVFLNALERSQALQVLSDINRELGSGLAGSGLAPDLPGSIRFAAGSAKNGSAAWLDIRI